MGELYDRMALDLKLKNLAGRTCEQYLQCCTRFAGYHMRSPRELGETAVKEYLGHLLLAGAGPETLKMHVAGLKFLYGVTLDRTSTRNRHASLMRSPAPYAVVSAIAGTNDVTALSNFSTSLPLKMSGFLCGTFGHGNRSATFEQEAHRFDEEPSGLAGHKAGCRSRVGGALPRAALARRRAWAASAHCGRHCSYPW